MEVPAVFRLQAHDRSLLAVIGAMCADHADVVWPIVVGLFPQQLADLLASALLTLFPCADVDQSGRRASVFSHGL